MTLLLKKNSRLFGGFEVELVDRHLFITEQPAVGKPRAFKVDVACLTPELPVERPQAKQWLLTLVIAAAAAGLTGFLAHRDIAPAITEGIAAVAAFVAIIAALVFRVRSARSLVLATRNARYPLLRIRPYHRKHPDVAQFVEALRTRILEAETKRGLNAEQLRSGEIRTLRRLCNEAVLTTSQYEEAKHAVLDTLR